MEEDRRSFQVALTESGREMAEGLLPMIPKLSVDLWRDFSTEDREVPGNAAALFGKHPRLKAAQLRERQAKTAHRRSNDRGDHS
jgi:DNA-binding MarR family transcriptional regulator